MRGRTTSSANRVWPVHLARASTFRNGLPMTFLGLPYPLFIAIDRLFDRLGRFASHSCRSELNCFVDLQVARAATKVPCKRIADLTPARVWVLFNKLFGSEQETGRAIPALGRAQISKRVLQGM